MRLIATQLLSAAAQGVDRVDAQLLMLHACGRSAHDRAWLIAHDQDTLSEAQWASWQSALLRRQQGEPVAYILGYKEFYGLRLIVNANVLDPRDDTETLVDWALELIPQGKPFKVLDLGTGSGAIALAIAKQRPLAQVTATDASSTALSVAKANAAALELAARFVQADAKSADWFSCLTGEVFDLIVSNPPYIAEGDAHLAALQHEPAMALTSGKDGLDAIRSITTHAPAHLKPGGWLLIEHGYDQASQVRALLAAQSLSRITTRQDLAGVDRCTGAAKP
jgi:release factor glutamine methyltransferase